MPKSSILILAAALTLAGITLTTSAAAPKAAPKPTTPKTADKPREFGGPMPLPVDQRLSRENKPSDRLIVEVTHSAKDGDHYVAYVKLVWGDLDNLIKKTGSQFYSDWDGSLKVPGGTGAIDEKIQFDDKTGTHKSVPVTPAKPAAKPAPKAGSNEPRAGSGRDEVEVAAGPDVEWKSGVVGALDGLRLKITSPNATIHATLTAGKFTIPLTITPAAVAPPLPSPPAPLPPSPPPVNNTPLNSSIQRIP